jgi:PIN domain nuclease of toxin-antitoxin system
VRFLLDTHTFLWFIGGDSKLSAHALQLMENTGNDRLLSIASLWEMSIKASIGRLRLNTTFPNMVKDHVIGNAMDLLSVRPEHLEIVRSLAFHHKDPFDRLIIAQSQSENLPVFSRNPVFDDYEGVRRIWDLQTV